MKQESCKTVKAPSVVSWIGAHGCWRSSKNMVCFVLNGHQKNNLKKLENSMRNAPWIPIKIPHFIIFPNFKRWRPDGVSPSPQRSTQGRAGPWHLGQTWKRRTACRWHFLHPHFGEIAEVNGSLGRWESHKGTKIASHHPSTRKSWDYD